MIFEREILKGNKCPVEYQSDLLELLIKMNNVSDAYGRPMIVTSGFRTLQDHIKIYAKKGITDKSKIPLHSKHLFAQACDILDTDGTLYSWCVDNEKLLRTVGLWIEKDTKGWVHFQIKPFASYKVGGTIFFKP
jgi:hypothetical protein